jgi:hypothetical protein
VSSFSKLLGLLESLNEETLSPLTIDGQELRIKVSRVDGLGIVTPCSRVSVIER